MKPSRLFIATLVYVVAVLSYAGLAQVPPRTNIRSATIQLPGHKQPIAVKFKVEHGRAIFQGDIDLGRADRLQPPAGRFRSSRRGIGTTTQALSVRAGDGYLWPGGIVPFEFDANLLKPENQNLRNNVQAAINFYNANTNLQFLPSSDALVFLRFKEDSGISGSGESPVGRVAQGSQTIKLKSTAPTSTIIHEMGHAIGLWHEQSRRDRDTNVEVIFDNILDGEEHNFDKHVDDGLDFGPYDTNSVMHYSSSAFARRDPLTGRLLTTIRSRIPTAAIAPSATLSPRDIAGINRLYPPNDCGRVPLLFQDDSKRGRQVSLQFSERNLHTQSMGDSASSICVPMGWTVDLFENVNFGGATLQVVGPAEILDLKRSMPNGRDWGDTISSARVSGAAANPLPNSCEVATVFEHHNFRGREMQLTTNVATLHQFGLGDKISSVCVPDGVTITLFENTGFGGDFIELTGPINIPQLQFDAPDGNNWNDLFSSARLSGANVNTPPPDCGTSPVLFADDNFRGERINITANTRDLHQLNFGDKASSICIPAGWSITVFQNTDFGGQSLDVPSNIADLQRDRPNAQDWGDKISSVRVTPPAGTAEVTCTEPVLFEHDGFQGRQFPMVRDTANLHLFDAGDKASSACIPANFSVVLFEHTNFGGASLMLTGPTSVRDMQRDRPNGQNWGDRISSVRVTPPAGAPAFTACSEPIFYHDDHYRGRSRVITSTINDLHATGDGDKASSICIPPGRTVTFFEDKNLTGRSLRRTGPAEIFDLKRDRPDDRDWGDKISSVRVN